MALPRDRRKFHHCPGREGCYLAEVGPGWPVPVPVPVPWTG